MGGELWRGEGCTQWVVSKCILAPSALPSPLNIPAEKLLQRSGSRPYQITTMRKQPSAGFPSGSHAPCLPPSLACSKPHSSPSSPLPPPPQLSSPRPGQRPPLPGPSCSPHAPTHSGCSPGCESLGLSKRRRRGRAGRSTGPPRDRGDTYAQRGICTRVQDVDIHEAGGGKGGRQGRRQRWGAPRCLSFTSSKGSTRSCHTPIVRTKNREVKRLAPDCTAGQHWDPYLNLGPTVGPWQWCQGDGSEVRGRGQVYEGGGEKELRRKEKPAAEMCARGRRLNPGALA